MSLDARTQGAPGYTGQPLIKLNGSGINDNGLRITGNSSTVAGFAIVGFNGDGIRIEGDQNLVVANVIGIDPVTLGQSPVGGDGVEIAGGNNNRIGGASASEHNVIAYSSGYGIQVTGSASGNALLGNSTAGSGLAQINLGNPGTEANDALDADSGSNSLQNFPVLTSAHADQNGTQVIGSLASAASTTYRIEFFQGFVASADNRGDARRFLGATTVTTDGSGNASFNTVLDAWVNGGEIVTATATVDLGGGNYGNTSAFAQNVTATSSGVIVVNTASNSVNGNTSSIAALQSSPGTDSRISLAEAITAANNTANGGTPDLIAFDIFDLGTPTITPTSALPTITNAVIIDGSTQPALFDGLQRIVLDGNNLAASGLTLGSAADGSTIRGLVIRDFGNNGILIQSGSDNHLIVDNYIGSLTDIGTSAGAGEANGSNGITIYGSGTTVGGSVAGQGNVLSGNGNDGVMIDGGTNNIVQGNFIGVDVSGTSALSNGADGLRIMNSANGNLIGGTVAGAGNVISANGDYGILVWGSNANTIQGNFIGTDTTGTLVLGNNTTGIDLGSTSSGNLVGGTAAGAGNTIAYNTSGGGLGILVGASATGNALLANSIYQNGDLGIDLNGDGVTANDAGDGDTGANGLQNYPVLTSASSSGGNTTIVGTLNSNASTTLRVEFFSSAAADPTGNGEGKVYLGFTTVTTDGSGNAVINATLIGVTVTAGHFVTATATVDLGGGNYGSTSEFGANVVATADSQAPVIAFGGGDIGFTENASAVFIDTAPPLRMPTRRTSTPATWSSTSRPMAAARIA
ncbi:MAG: right-handed parallel beta-helix repeat-containing protein [Burkholderiaceae bacterium]